MSYKQKADLVLLNGKIITVDSKDTISQAVAVKAGRIVYVGDAQGIKPLIGEKTKKIDLKGKPVLPGFIDAHVHFDATAVNTKLAVDCHIPPVRYVEVSGSSVS